MATTDSGVRWEDFDNGAVFESLQTKAKGARAKNFVLEFDAQNAQCAFDVEHGGIQSLLSERKVHHDEHESFRTRWINIWMPETQPEVINHIARHYGFSPRLKSSMNCRHLTPVRISSRQDQQHHRTAREMMHGVPRKGRDVDAVNIASIAKDLDGHEMETPPKKAKTATFDVNHYRIVDEVWHFASVDWGYKFTCIGFNSLYRGSKDLSDEEQAESDKPAGKRVWTWLILCNDHTIISIHENPYPSATTAPELEVKSIRHNLMNVFRQLSKSTIDNELQNPIMTVNIRAGLHGHEGDEAQVSEESGASLLFYYLFDDWYTSYCLVARYEHQYGAHLDRIRNDMFDAPDLDSARQLHHFGRQLAVLKRIYESYTMIIDRLLKGPQASFRGAPAVDDLRTLTRATTNFTTNSTNAIRETGFAYGVPVSTAAAVRFERLRDRIGLYALSEIKDCLAEKEALVMLNFNLVALKESSFVERLTRITILLAKVTILFLPVSLLSAYFAIPIVGVGDRYTLTQYWAAFAVVFALSAIALILFGRLSGTQEGKPIYQSLTRGTYELGRLFFSRKRTANKRTTVNGAHT